MMTNAEIAENAVIDLFYREHIGALSHEGKEQIKKRIIEILDAKDAAARPPDGHIMEPDGTVRKVLGTLPVTADGCVIAHNNMGHGQKVIADVLVINRGHVVKVWGERQEVEA